MCNIFKLSLSINQLHILTFSKHTSIVKLSKDFYTFLLSARPPGVFEFANFATGTKAVMDAVVQATQGGAVTIIGETVTFLKYCEFACKELVGVVLSFSLHT